MKNNSAIEYKQLFGHQLAVTCLDWQKMNKSLGTILISCSDDRTIRVYDSENDYGFKFEFSTSFREEWHTLTYLAL